MAIPVPPPPPGAPQQPPATQKTSDVVGTFRSAKLFKLSKPETAVTSLDFDDSGEFLLAACDDDSLQLYNAKEGKHMKQLLSQKYGAHLARFTHHPTSIVYASTKVDDGIRYLSTHDNAFLRYFKGHTKPVTSIAMCPASDTFMSCSLDDTVRLWDLKSPSPQGRLNLTTPYLAAYDPSATVIAIASSLTHTILLYDLRNYDKPPFATFDIHPFLHPDSTYNAAALSTAVPDWTRLDFSNDGKSILLGTNNPHKGHLLLDAFDGTLRAKCMRSSSNSSANGHTNGLTQSPASLSHNLRAAPGAPGALGQGDVCFTSDGRYLIGGGVSAPGGGGGGGGSSSSNERDALVWDTQAPGAVEVETKFLRPLCALPSKTRTAVVECNPRYNMIATADREVLFWVPDEHVGMKPA